MTIGVLCAIPQELGHLRDALTGDVTERVAGLQFDRGRLDGHELVLVGAGIGKVNTALTATLLAERFGCRLIVFSGVAGGLDPALRIGDVVIADRTLQHDAGVIEDEQARRPTRPATCRSSTRPTASATPSTRRWSSGCARASPGSSCRRCRAPAGRPGTAAAHRFGTILSGDQYVHCEATRERLHGTLGGQAVEMEGGALGQVCEAFGVPVARHPRPERPRRQGFAFDFAAFVHRGGGEFGSDPAPTAAGARSPHRYQRPG